MAGSPQEDEGSRAKGSPDKSDKLPRAHKRCINKDCREVLTLATKFCKKCNMQQFERKNSAKRKGEDDSPEGKAKVGKKRKAGEEGASPSREEAAAAAVAAAAAEVREGQAAEKERSLSSSSSSSSDDEDGGGTSEVPDDDNNIPQATSYAIQQPGESWDAPPFACATGPDKPMMELNAGSRVYYQASIIRESKTEIRVIFPETKKMQERLEWVDKRSSRIWRGRMESRYWRYIKGSDGGWEPKGVFDSSLAGSFKRRGSGRSRGSAGGATRSRGTKQSTEEGDESELQKGERGAAADTAASPRPRGMKKAAIARARGPGDAAAKAGSSSGGSGAEEGSGESDGERQGSGACAAAAEQQQGGAEREGSDPLASWFKQHYSLLKAGGLLGTGLLPASAETGRPWAHGARRARGQQHRRGDKPTAEKEQRSREQRRAERQVAREQAQSSEGSEDEGLAADTPRALQRRGSGKGGRELKRLQMWAWERRGRDSGSSDDEDESDESGSEEGSAEREPAGKQQQQRQQVKAEPKEERPSKQQRAGQAPAGKQEQAAQGAASPPGNGAAKQQRPKPPQLGAAAAGQQQQQQQPKPRPAWKPVAPLEECDVFGKLGPPKHQQSLPVPTSPRGAATLAGGAKSPPGAAGSRPEPQQPQQQGSDAAREANDKAVAAATASPADAAPAAERKQAEAGAAPAAPEQALTANGSGAPAGLPPVAVAAAAAAGGASPSKRALSPLKRKLLERTGAGAAAGAVPAAASEPAAPVAACDEDAGAAAGEPAAEEPPAKRQHVEASEGCTSMQTDQTLGAAAALVQAGRLADVDAEAGGGAAPPAKQPRFMHVAAAHRAPVD